jgi:hypothetical protein
LIKTSTKYWVTSPKPTNFKPTSLAGSAPAESKEFKPKEFKPSAVVGTTKEPNDSTGPSYTTGPSTGPSASSYFQPSTMKYVEPPKSPVENKKMEAKSFNPVNSLRGKKVILDDIPTIADLRQMEPVADEKDLHVARDLLIRNIPAKGVRRDWSDFGVLEQREAAKLASQFLEISKRRAAVDAQSMMAMVNDLVDRLYDWFEPKGFFGKLKNEDAKFQENMRNLENCVSNLKVVSSQLDPVINEVRNLGEQVVELEEKVRALLIANHALAKIRPVDEIDIIDSRLLSLTKSWNNLLEMKITSSSMGTSLKAMNSLLMDTVLTTIPSWISVTTLHYLSNNSNRIMAKNKLEEFRSNIKGAI